MKAFSFVHLPFMLIEFVPSSLGQCLNWDHTELSPACHWLFLHLLQVVIAKFLRYSLIITLWLFGAIEKYTEESNRHPNNSCIAGSPDWCMGIDLEAWRSFLLLPLWMALSHCHSSWTTIDHMPLCPCSPQGQNLSWWAQGIERAGAKGRMCTSFRPSSPRKGATEPQRKKYLQIPPITAHTPHCLSSHQEVPSISWLF